MIRLFRYACTSACGAAIGKIAATTRWPNARDPPPAAAVCAVLIHIMPDREHRPCERIGRFAAFIELMKLAMLRDDPRVPLPGTIPEGSDCRAIRKFPSAEESKPVKEACHALPQFSRRSGDSFHADC